MTPRRVKIMVLMHASISLGGVLIHGKLHPPADSLYFLWAAPVSMVSLTIIPLLYVRPSTVAWGFLMNAATILIGTVGMSYHFVITTERTLTLYNVFMHSALPGIFIVWIKLPVSLVILYSMRPLQSAQRERRCAGAPE